MLPTYVVEIAAYQHRIFYVICVGIIYDATDVIIIYHHICITMMMVYAMHVRIVMHTTSVSTLMIV